MFLLCRILLREWVETTLLFSVLACHEILCRHSLLLKTEIRSLCSRPLPVTVAWPWQTPREVSISSSVKQSEGSGEYMEISIIQAKCSAQQPMHKHLLVVVGGVVIVQRQWCCSCQVNRLVMFALFLTPFLQWELKRQMWGKRKLSHELGQPIATLKKCLSREIFLLFFFFRGGLPRGFRCFSCSGQQTFPDFCGLRTEIYV